MGTKDLTRFSVHIAGRSQVVSRSLDHTNLEGINILGMDWITRYMLKLSFDGEKKTAKVFLVSGGGGDAAAPNGGSS